MGSSGVESIIKMVRLTTSTSLQRRTNSLHSGCLIVDKKELFEIVTKIIASPHTAITEHDKRRAIQVFLAFDDYLIDVDVAAGRCDVGDEYDFCSYASEQLDILEGKK